jgi:hypothetical protein
MGKDIKSTFIVGRIFSINPIVLRHLADSSKNLITRCFKPEYFFYSFCGGNMYVYLMYAISVYHHYCCEFEACNRVQNKVEMFCKPYISTCFLA